MTVNEQLAHEATGILLLVPALVAAIWGGYVWWDAHRDGVPWFCRRGVPSYPWAFGGFLVVVVGGMFGLLALLVLADPEPVAPWGVVVVAVLAAISAVTFVSWVLARTHGGEGP